MGAPAELKEQIEQARSAEPPRNILNLPPMPEGCTATDLMQRDFPEPTMIVPELLAEGLGILAGKPKTGKSWLALGLAVASASGGRALGKVRVDEGPVLYLALEDTERRLKSRLQQVLCGNMPPERLYFMTSWPRIDQGALPLLQNWLEAHPDTRFVIVDTLARLWPKPNGKDGNAYHQDYGTVSAIKSIADLHHVAILCVTHLRKTPTDDPLEQISGSMGISGSADTLLVLQRSRGKADANLLVTGRDIEEQELALRFDQVTGTWVHLGEAEEYRRSEEQSEALSSIKKYEDLSVKELGILLGVKEDTAYRRLVHLMKDGFVEKAGRGRYRYKKESLNSNVPSIPDYPGVPTIPSIPTSQTGTTRNGPNREVPTLDEGEAVVYGKLGTFGTLGTFVTKIKCADCRHYTFGIQVNMPGRCDNPTPYEGNRVQFPQLQHDCEMFTRRDAE